MASIEDLRATLSDQAVVVTPGDEGYVEGIERWSTAAEKPAGIVVFPTSPQDVAATVRFSTANGIDLAVVCGGHATSASSSIDGGLCINLSKMRKVVVQPNLKLIFAEGGCLWKDVDEEAAKYGLATVGGTVNHTGIGGLTLGGGYGYLVGVHGLVIDNLASAEVVLADGSIVIASRSENPDLFWALRGAGTSFGIVTKFCYRAYEQGPVWAATLVFATSQLSDVIEAANKNLDLKNENSVILISIAAPPPALKPMIVVVLFYNGLESEAMVHYEPFFRKEVITKKMSMMPYAQLNTVLNDGLESGFRRSLKGSAFLVPLDISFAQGILEDFEDFLRSTPDASPSIVLFEFFPFDKIISIPQTATAFANRGAYNNLLFGMGWTKAENDEACREWTRKMAAKARLHFEKRKTELAADDGITKHGVGEYFNYDGLGISGQLAFGVNYPRLVELKRKYDPGNVFNKGPKLFGA